MTRRTKQQIDKMREIFEEAGVYSINRVFPGVLFVLTNSIYWLIVIIMFFIEPKFNAFGEVTTAYISMQTLIAGWLTGNKFTNSKYNTEPGEPGKPEIHRVEERRDTRRTGGIPAREDN